MNGYIRIRPLLRVPPPLLFLGAFLAGYGIERLLPLGHSLRSHASVTDTLGFALLGAGMLLVLACMASFLKVRTTVLPHGVPSHLVSTGPYRLSRNPMYVSLALIYLGTAILMQLLWPLLLLPLPLVILNQAIIPFEETRLATAFGEAYAAYRRKVRRWL